MFKNCFAKQIIQLECYIFKRDFSNYSIFKSRKTIKLLPQKYFWGNNSNPRHHLVTPMPNTYTSSYSSQTSQLTFPILYFNHGYRVCDDARQSWLPTTEVNFLRVTKE